MSEVKNINKYEESVNNGETKAVELTPTQQLKCTISDARDKAIMGLNDAIVWCVNNPKKAVGIAGGALAGFNTFGLPILRYIRDFRERHTYTFYDYKNHESLTLRRKLTNEENKALLLYMDDRTAHHFASDWLRQRNLLK